MNGKIISLYFIYANSYLCNRKIRILEENKLEFN